MGRRAGRKKTRAWKIARANAAKEEEQRMAKTKETNPEPVSERIREYAKCNLSFPTDSKVKLNGFNSAGVNEKIRVLVTGTVQEISDSAEEWSPGKRMTVRIKQCTIKGPDKETSIDDALRDSVDKV